MEYRSPWNKSDGLFLFGPHFEILKIYARPKFRSKKIARIFSLAPSFVDRCCTRVQACRPLLMLLRLTMSTTAYLGIFRRKLGTLMARTATADGRSRSRQTGAAAVRSISTVMSADRTNHERENQRGSALSRMNTSSFATSMHRNNLASDRTWSQSTWPFSFQYLLGPYEHDDEDDGG